jgi:hypothetical protein
MKAVALRFLMSSLLQKLGVLWLRINGARVTLGSSEMSPLL